MSDWVSVVNYDFPGSRPKRVIRKHFDLTLSKKGFVIFDPSKDGGKLDESGLVPDKKAGGDK